MKLTYRDDIVRRVPARWADQYYRDSKRTNVTRKLKDLHWPFSAATVDAIIGNDSWTKHNCDECGESHDMLVRLGQEPDYEARWHLCAGCLAKAIELISR